MSWSGRDSGVHRRLADEMGLGTCCLGTPHGERIKAGLGIPARYRVLLLQTVGYPAEHWEAGGQRPRLPLGELYQMNHHDNPFPREEEVVEELKADKMITRPAPTPEGSLACLRAVAL